MDIPGWISAIAGLGGLLLGEHRRRAAKRDIEKKTSKVGASQSREARENFGWSAQEIRSSLLVLNKQGDIRVVRALDKVQSDNDVASIPGHFRLATPGCRIKNGPRLREQPGFPKAVTCDYTDTKTGDKVPYTVTITNNLTPNDPPLSYSVEIDCERGVLTSPEAVKRAYAKDAFKWDYYSVRVTFPIERLTIVVEFGTDWSIKTFPGVFYGHESHHELKFQRVCEGFSGGSRSTFKIEEPKFGFEYLIYWKLTD